MLDNLEFFSFGSDSQEKHYLNLPRAMTNLLHAMTGLLLEMVDNHNKPITAHFNHHTQALPCQDTQVYIIMSDMVAALLHVYLPSMHTPSRNGPTQNYNSKRYMHPCVHNIIIHNSQDMETT